MEVGDLVRLRTGEGITRDIITQDRRAAEFFEQKLSVIMGRYGFQADIRRILPSGMPGFEIGVHVEYLDPVDEASLTDNELRGLTILRLRGEDI